VHWVTLVSGHTSMLNVPRWVFEDAVGLPDVNQLLTHRARLDSNACVVDSMC
jgi:hypothetical protein